MAGESFPRDIPPEGQFVEANCLATWHHTIGRGWKAAMTQTKKAWYGVLGWLLVIVVAFLLVGAIGCQKPAAQGDPKTTDVPRLVSGRLPELGDYLPPLDEGRLELAPPKDWAVAPRSNRYIVRFQADTNSTYPSVLVVGSTSERFKAVTAENLEAFAKAVAAELESAGAKTTVKMGRIGNLIGVTYTRRARVKDDFGGIVERLFFDTVVAGRRYQFELRCPPEMVGLAEPYFFAIVSGAKVASVTELEDELPEGESVVSAKKEEKPQRQAEEKPGQEATTASEKPKTQVAEIKPTSSEKPTGQVSQEPGKASPKTDQKAAAKQDAASQAAKEESKEPEKTAPKVESAPPPSQEGKPEEKPKGKKTEDVLKDVDALLQ